MTDDTKSLPDNWLDETLDWFSSYVATNHVISTGRGYARRRTENDEMQAKAKQAILRNLEQEMLDVIGEDESEEMNSALYVIGIDYDAVARNRLRATQRPKLTALIGRLKG